MTLGEPPGRVLQAQLSRDAPEHPERDGMRRLSVVIPNYNYERFVGEAIESALALDWPDVEVIVADDGSTDSSLDVIRRYEPRITVLPGVNSTQRVAVNRALGVVTGDVVIILDSDDVLPPDLPRHLARVWTPETSKVQFLMQPIDADGNAAGPRSPRYGGSPSQLRDWMVRTSAYPTPPGSGNAYARWFIDLLAPVDQRVGNASDSALLAAAPLLGDVITVPDVVVGYRRHDANDSNLLRDTTRFAREIARARARWQFAVRVAPSMRLSESSLGRSRELLQMRVAARAARPHDEASLPGDGWLRMAWDALRSPFHPGPEPVRTRALIALWSLSTLLAPRRLAMRLLRARYR